MNQAALSQPVPEAVIQPTTAWVERADRIRTILWVARLMAPDGEHLCRIRNVSTGGMLLESDAELAPGDRVAAELRNFHRLVGVVRWTQDGRAGVEFDAPIDVAMVSTAPLGDARRPRAPRLSALTRVLLWHEGRNYPAKMLDVSQSGCRLESDHTLPTGAVVRLSIPGLPPRYARHCWQRDAEAGFAFTEFFAFDELYAWRPGRTRDAAGG